MPTDKSSSEECGKVYNRLSSLHRPEWSPKQTLSVVRQLENALIEKIDMHAILEIILKYKVKKSCISKIVANSQYSSVNRKETF